MLGTDQIDSGQLERLLGRQWNYISELSVRVARPEFVNYLAGYHQRPFPIQQPKCAPSWELGVCTQFVPEFSAKLNVRIAESNLRVGHYHLGRIHSSTPETGSIVAV
jgi:hypothetical protein